MKIECLYDAAGGGSSWDEALDALTHWLGGSATGVIVRPTNLRSPPEEMLASSGLDPEALAGYSAYYHRVDPFLQGAPFLPSQVFVSDAVVPIAQLVCTEFYSDWMQPNGMHRYLLAAAPLSGERIAALVIARGPDGSLFDSDTLRRASSVTPHLFRALDLWDRFKWMEQLHRHQRAMLDALADAAILIGPNLTWLAHNAAADDLLQVGVLRNHRGTISFAQPGAMKYIHAALQGSEGMASRCEVLVGVRRFELCLRSLPPRLCAAGSVAVLFVKGLKEQQNVDITRFATEHRLTHAETRLVRGLAAGSTLALLARRHGIAMSTLRTQLRSVFSKTGTARQAELVARALSTPLAKC